MSSQASSSLPPATVYPKCNISLTMSANSEHLTVITTSVASGGELGGAGITGTSGTGIPILSTGGTNIVPFSVSQLPPIDKLPEVDIKPIILGVSKAATQTAPTVMAAQLPPTHVPVIEIKKEQAVLEIPYDRERILNFLTDYWKSKNLQQVTEAQQQTAGVTGVASSDFCPAPQRIVEEALFDLFVEYPMVCDVTCTD